MNNNNENGVLKKQKFILSLIPIVLLGAVILLLLFYPIPQENQTVLGILIGLLGVCVKDAYTDYFNNQKKEEEK